MTKQSRFTQARIITLPEEHHPGPCAAQGTMARRHPAKMTTVVAGLRSCGVVASWAFNPDGL